MDAKNSYPSTSLPDGSKEQEPSQPKPSESHQPPSQSSLTYTKAPSSTEASGQSVTAPTDTPHSFENEASFARQHRLALAADQQDLAHAGSWATIGRLDDIGNDSMLSPNYQAGTAVDSARRGNGLASSVVDEAVELLRASLHRKV
ncbi:hypothetical protein TSTA_102240 [Talaromyces stipitatus ATCC 10500]|uniref:Uncharacterized protein n=1 Tax=Talaromyces stipitatus (strain ATCC 10500 / CBS 375.48 / QM 6759 / NRRL 1006) TaxID=441959 RepID=B8MN45_TALSN|nr:uncharacterized protein TSTA_102240 [Talaromyces stipitatus ATCC 10500]EED13994.1 hypothetical protein TSTA_102240 [Talaromyces stipitatus ATCC 10500]